MNEFDELFTILGQYAKSHPGQIQKVDADAGDRADLWGKEAMRITFADGRVLWVQPVDKTPRRSRPQDELAR